MDGPVPPTITPHRRALDFALDALGLRTAHAQSAEDDRVLGLEREVAALRAANARLRATARALRPEIAVLAHASDLAPADKHPPTAAAPAGVDPSANGPDAASADGEAVPDRVTEEVWAMTAAMTRIVTQAMILRGRGAPGPGDLGRAAPGRCARPGRRTGADARTPHHNQGGLTPRP